jgi:S1-C subfamily serine protease
VQRRFREPASFESVLLPTTIIKPASESISQDISERLLQLGWDSDQADEVVQKVRASTVCVMANASSEHCNATAVVVGPDLLATCGHCAHGHEEEQETKTLFIRTIGGIKMDAKVLAIHPSTDLGLIQVVSNKETLPSPLVIGFASPGEAVVVVGHPSGIGTWVVKAGKILSVDLSPNTYLC